MLVLEPSDLYFPTATGVGVDNISPRALLRLPDALLEELAQVLMQAEEEGSWSDALALVVRVGKVLEHRLAVYLRDRRRQAFEHAGLSG